MQNHWQKQKWQQGIGEEGHQHGHQPLLGGCHREMLSAPGWDKGQHRQGHRQDTLRRAGMTRELLAASWAVGCADNLGVFPASFFPCKIDFLLIIQLLLILEHQCLPHWFTIDQGACSLLTWCFLLPQHQTFICMQRKRSTWKIYPGFCQPSLLVLLSPPATKELSKVMFIII